MALIGLNVMFYVSFLLSANLACTPYRGIWDITVASYCWDSRVYNIVSAINNILIDVGVLLLPQKVIWKLHLSRSQRLGLSGVFAIGSM